MLAIIIPYYKLAFFEATLQSLAAQICQDFKVYIGNDASPEDPSMLLEKYKGMFDFVYHRFETNLGATSLTQQWERCIALSDNEEWLMILGDDDVLGENVVEEFYKNLHEIEQIGSNVVRFATQVINGEGKAISGLSEHPKLEKATDSFWRKFKGETRSSLSEYIFSRVTYSKYGFKDYPLAWHSDDMAWLEFSMHLPIYSISSTPVFVRFSEINISGKTDNQQQKLKATNLFLTSLIVANTSNFLKCQKQELLLELEVKIKKERKLKIEEWFFLAKNYFIFFQFFSFLKFSKRFISSYLK
jgi:hypothetical protein